MIFYGLMAANIWIVVFWILTPCHLVSRPVRHHNPQDQNVKDPLIVPPIPTTLHFPDITSKFRTIAIL
jgi:hypothetical protein